MRATVAIVVPVWNQARLLERLLDSISRQTVAPDGVIVVDNASSDDAAEVARRWGARVISVGENRGFAAAANLGIAACSSEWVGLVNSDVELEPAWLGTLMQAGVETGAAFCCGMLLMHADRSRIDGTWDLIATSGFPLRAGYGQTNSTRFNTRRPIALAPATATLYRRKLFELVGAFDEQYESYLEDVDFSLRCAAEGFAGVYEPSAIAYHVGSAGLGAWSARMVELNARNQILLVRKLFPLDLQRKFRMRIWMGRALWGALALRHGAFSAWVSGTETARRTPVQHLPLDPKKLEMLLRESEREIRRIQRSDTYWRLYFLIPWGESR